MDGQIENVLKALEAAKKLSRNGGEYWMGRELQSALGYTTWENFEGVVTRAKDSAAITGVDIGNHFREATKKVLIGSSTQRDVQDYFLSRYACYLIAMNGDPRKSEIAAAQTYFAIQARRQEVHDELQLEKRVQLRTRVTEAVKLLNSTAKEAGVQNYALFHDAGYRGLYEMGLTEIKRRKGLEDKEDLFDHAGRAELAANEFRYTQAEQKIIRENIRGQQQAMVAHKEVGQQVRATIQRIGGTMPEDLKPEPSLKKLAKAKNKEVLPKPKAS